MRVRHSRWVFLAIMNLPAIAGAAILQGNPGNYRTLLDQLQPGDTLELAAGDYFDGLPVTNLHGSAGAPIVIRGPQSGATAVLHADNCCNTVQFDDASYIEVSHLTLDGNGTDGPFGVASRNVTHHIIVSDLLIINYGAGQQNVGISTKGPAWNWIVRRNRIIGAGTGMYFGNSDGSQPFVAGLIEYNVVLDTLGYNAQIKHQNPRPTDIGIPGGTNRTIIRHNVFSKANNASGGGSARPNLLVGHLPLSGEGQNDVYEIYGNFFYENPTEALFQGEGNIGLYANLFVTSTGNAINIMPHNAVPRSVSVFQNTVVAAGRGIYITGGDSGFSQRAIGNAVFASPAVQSPNGSANITDAYGEAQLYLNNPYGALGVLDLHPREGTLVGPTPDTSPFSSYTDWDLDFNGDDRDQAIRGAYGGDGTNPGWQLALDTKETTGITTPSAPGTPPGVELLPPQLSLAASPGNIVAGASATLTWSSTDATQCTASGGWSGNKPTSGSQAVGPLSATSQFSLTCSGLDGVTSRAVTVTVTPAAAVDSGSAAPALDASAAEAASGGGGGTADWVFLTLLAGSVVRRLTASSTRRYIRSTRHRHPISGELVNKIVKPSLELPA